jgi:hypothetical protein
VFCVVFRFLFVLLDLDLLNADPELLRVEATGSGVTIVRIAFLLFGTKKLGDHSRETGA